MKHTLLFIAWVLASWTMSAQDGLAFGDVQKSSCLSETRGEEADPMKSLYGEWWLVGWNDGGTWYGVDKKNVRYHNLSIEFNENGYVTAYSMVNSIGFGRVTLNGNEMHFDGEGYTTEVGCYDMENIFFEDHVIYIKSYHLDGKRLRLYYTDNDYFVFTKDLNDNEELSEYRPLVEEGKVWKVGDVTSGNPVQLVDYYYFDGETIIDGKTCKQMMRQRYVSPDYAETHNLSQDNIYVGAWYEEDKKVYFSDANSEQLTLMYDFSVDANDTIEINNMSYVIGPKQTGDKEGFKGVYRNVRLWEDGVSYYSVPWLEGVGGTDRPTTSVYPGVVDPLWFLMECYVDDEVIYFNGAEDGATPAGARKQRIDFTHTPKIKPKTREGSEENQSLYGEYNEQRLSINLDPINDAYMVSITDDSGKAVYEKAINAGNIVGLNIDISKFAKGDYTVTIENSNESFIGEFKAQLTGIEAIRSKTIEVKGYIYNLQGQRLSSLQKGLNIVNGKKVILSGK